MTEFDNQKQGRSREKKQKLNCKIIAGKVGISNVEIYLRCIKAIKVM
jgi:hypothetical protein